MQKKNSNFFSPGVGPQASVPPAARDVALRTPVSGGWGQSPQTPKQHPLQISGCVPACIAKTLQTYTESDSVNPLWYKVKRYSKHSHAEWLSVSELRIVISAIQASSVFDHSFGNVVNNNCGNFN